MTWRRCAAPPPLPRTVPLRRPIGQNQGIPFPLAEAHARLGAAEPAIRHGSWRIDQGRPAGEQANLAKFLAAEAGFAAADVAVRTHGGFGYATEYHVERYSGGPATEDCPDRGDDPE